MLLVTRYYLFSDNCLGDIPAGTVADFYLSPVLPAGQYRVVLTWGAVPAGNALP
jgi:hypothetical protein